MMTVGFVQAGNASYWTELARDDYWNEGGERPGRWFENEAASRFHLQGEVKKEVIERYFDGFHHETGEALAQNSGKEDRCAAYDLTFSLTKDQSALLAVVAPEDRRWAESRVEAALDKTLHFVNDHAGWTRRGSGGGEREKVDLLIAKYRHVTSRDGAPDWHAHCLVLNVARRDDRAYATVDGREFPAIKQAAGAYFRSQVAHELGLPLERNPRTPFAGRLVGVPESLTEHWSAGRRRIEAKLAEWGTSGARAAALAELATRPAKGESRPHRDLHQEWRETAERHGFTPTHAAKLIRGRDRGLSPEKADLVVDRAIDQAVDKLTRQEAHFTRYAVIAEVCNATVTRRIAPDRVVDRLDATLRQDRFRALGAWKGQEQFTTREVYEQVEKKAIEAVRTLGDRPSRPLADRLVERALKDSPKALNAGQRDAVRRICQGGHVTFIEGPPGAGKSTLFRVVRDAQERSGRKVLGLAPSNRAARELEASSGIRCTTIDKFLYDQKRSIAREKAAHHAKQLARAALKPPTHRYPRRAPLRVDRRTTLVVDECAMVDNWKLSKALQAAESAGARVVLSGDRRQLPAVGQGGLFAELVDRARPEQKAHLTEILRQRHERHKEAIKMVGSGRAAEALPIYQEREALTVAETRSEAKRRLIDDWKTQAIRSPRDTLILAATNDECRELNAAAQQAMKDARKLGWRSVRHAGETIREGERIVFKENQKKLGIINSEFATVTHIEMISRRLTVRIDGDAKPVTFGLSQLKGKGLGLGYCVTVHRSQGMTLEQDAFILAGSSMQSKELSYVQVSRAKGETRIYCDQVNAGPELHELARSMSVSREKVAAHAIERQQSKAADPALTPRKQVGLSLQR